MRQVNKKKKFWGGENENSELETFHLMNWRKRKRDRVDMGITAKKPHKKNQYKQKGSQTKRKTQQGGIQKRKKGRRKTKKQKGKTPSHKKKEKDREQRWQRRKKRACWIWKKKTRLGKDQLARRSQFKIGRPQMRYRSKKTRHKKVHRGRKKIGGNQEGKNKEAPIKPVQKTQPIQPRRKKPQRGRRLQNGD